MTSRTHLTPQIEGSRVRIRLLRSQLVGQPLSCDEHWVCVVFCRLRHDGLMEIRRCVEDRRDGRCVVMNTRVYQHTAVAGIALCIRGEVVDTAGLDVDRVDLGVIMLRKNRKLDGTAPRCGLKDGRYVLVAGPSRRRKNGWMLV